MPTPGKLRIVANPEEGQWRVEKERVAITLDALDFPDIGLDGCWRLPRSGAIALRPQVLDPEWHRQITGRYARLGLSDFTLSPAPGISTAIWEEKKDKPGSLRLTGGRVSAGSLSGITQATFGKNRGFFVGWYSFAVQNDAARVEMECGWASGGVYTSGVSLRFWSNGRVEIWKNGQQVGSHVLGPGAKDAGSASAGALMGSQYHDVVLIPQRRRELLVFSPTSGESFVHVFADIDEQDVDPEIVPDAPFWFGTGATTTILSTIDVEIAPLRYAATGTATSELYIFGIVPKTGQTLTTWTNAGWAPGITSARLYGDDAAVASTNERVSAVDLLKPDGGAFSPNGTDDRCHVRLTLHSDDGGGYTATLYGLHAAYAPTFVQTDGSEPFDLTPYVLEADLSVPDDPLGVRLTLRLKQPEALDAAEIPIDEDVAGGIPGLLAHESIPARVYLGEALMIDGLMTLTRFSDSTTDFTRRGQIEIRDRTALMERYQFRDRTPLDGAYLVKGNATGSAVRYLYFGIGVQGGELDLADETYRVGEVPPEKCESFNHSLDVGTTPAEGMQGLVSDMAVGFVWGFHPCLDGGAPGGGAPKAVFFDPNEDGDDPILTLWRDEDDAEDPETAIVYRSYDEERLPLEANEVRALGYDPRTRTALSSWAEDAASKDPTLAPSARPDNWCGEPRVVAYSSSRLTTQELCDQAVAGAFALITARQVPCSWTSDLLLHPGTDVPLWIGAKVELDGRRTLRVVSFSVKFIAELDDLVVRDASYIGGIPMGRGGNSLGGMRRLAEMRAARPNRTMGESDFLRGSFLSSASLVAT